MGAGKLLVDMLERDNDSRLNIYFLGSGTQDIIGVSPGDSPSECLYAKYHRSLWNAVGARICELVRE